jgi:hypothetical protein
VGKQVGVCAGRGDNYGFRHDCTARFARVKGDEGVKFAYLIVLFFGSFQASADGVKTITDIGPDGTVVLCVRLGAPSFC